MVSGIVLALMSRHLLGSHDSTNVSLLMTGMTAAADDVIMSVCRSPVIRDGTRSGLIIQHSRCASVLGRNLGQQLSAIHVRHVSDFSHIKRRLEMASSIKSRSIATG